MNWQRSRPHLAKEMGVITARWHAVPVMAHHRNRSVNVEQYLPQKTWFITCSRERERSRCWYDLSCTDGSNESCWNNPSAIKNSSLRISLSWTEPSHGDRLGHFGSFYLFQSIFSLAVYVDHDWRSVLRPLRFQHLYYFQYCWSILNFNGFRISAFCYFFKREMKQRTELRCSILSNVLNKLTFLSSNLQQHSFKKNQYYRL